MGTKKEKSYSDGQREQHPARGPMRAFFHFSITGGRARGIKRGLLTLFQTKPRVLVSNFRERKRRTTRESEVIVFNWIRRCHVGVQSMTNERWMTTGPV